MSCDCKKKQEPGKCSCIEMDLWCTHWCQLQECDNSETVKEDMDEGLSDCKSNNDNDWFLPFFQVLYHM